MRVRVPAGAHLKRLTLQLTKFWSSNINSFSSGQNNYSTSKMIVSSSSKKNSSLLLSKGSAVKILRWGGQVLYHLMPNFPRPLCTNKLLQEAWKNPIKGQPRPKVNADSESPTPVNMEYLTMEIIFSSRSIIWPSITLFKQRGSFLTIIYLL